MPDFNASMQARGMAGPYGKFTEEIKTLVDPQTFELWLRLCNSKSVTSSQLLRDLLLHGKTPAELTADDRRALLSEEGRNAALRRMGGRG